MATRTVQSGSKTPNPKYPSWSKETAAQISRKWQAHDQFIKKNINLQMLQADDIRPVWRIITQQDMILSALDDLRAYSPLNSDEEAVTQMADCLALALFAASRLVATKSDKPADTATLNLLLDSIFTLEYCWDASKDLVPRWLEDRTFGKRTRPYVTIAGGLEAIINIDSGPMTALNVLRYHLLKSWQTQDFLLAYITLNRSEVVWEAMKTLNTMMEHGNVLMPGIPKAVAGGAPALTRRLKELMSGESPKDGPLTIIRIIRNLIGASTAVFVPALTDHDELAIAIAERSWQLYPVWAKEQPTTANTLLLHHFIPIIALLKGTIAQTDHRLKILFKDCDFASLIAKCLYIFSQQDENSEFIPTGVMATGNELIEGYLPTECERQPRLLKAALLRDKNYLTVLDQLRTSTGKDAALCVRTWERLGAIAGLQELVLRAEAVAARRVAAGGLVGCSWYKCVMYRQESDQIMHWCTGCKKVVYCGYFCKAGDWNEGHKDECRKGTR